MRTQNLERSIETEQRMKSTSLLQQNSKQKTQLPPKPTPLRQSYPTHTVIKTPTMRFLFHSSQPKQEMHTPPTVFQVANVLISNV